MNPVELSFRSEVVAPPARVWEQVTSLNGIVMEMMPILRTTAPRGIKSISNLDVTLGQAVFSSWLFLFGVFPIGRMRITLIQLEEGAAFTEQSPMSGMRLWRHERRLIPSEKGCIVMDRLTFEPMFLRSLTTAFVRALFTHRHAVLRHRFGAVT